MLKSQYSTTTAGAVRPGDGYFLGLLALRRLPDTLWALGGEYSQSRWIALPWILGALLGAVTLLGAWVERRRWGAILALATVAAAFLHFAVREHYSYAAYKIISVNFWMISFFTVAGGIWLAEWAKPRLPQRVSIAAVVTTVLLVVVADRTVVQANVIRFKHNALQQKAYREAQTISGLVQHAPTLLAVRDDLANEWAVFYLSDAAAPDRALSDLHGAGPRHPVHGTGKACGPGRNPLHRHRPQRHDPRAPLGRAADLGRRGLQPLGSRRRRLDGACRRHQSRTASSPVGSGWAARKPTFWWWRDGQVQPPSSPTSSLARGPRRKRNSFMLPSETSAGARTIEIQPGEIRIPIDLTAGKSSISITIDDPVGGNNTYHW